MNLVGKKTHNTINVARAPTALIASDFFQFAGAVTSSVTKYERCISSSASAGSGNGPSLVRASLEATLFASRNFLRSRNQWTTMPDCDNVNDRKTPTA